MRMRLFLLGVILLASGCALFSPAVEFRWGDAVYRTNGDHELEDLDVTREVLPDGSERIRIKVKTSIANETRAVTTALEVAKEAIKLVPRAP